MAKKRSAPGPPFLISHDLYRCVQSAIGQAADESSARKHSAMFAVVRNVKSLPELITKDASFAVAVVDAVLTASAKRMAEWYKRPEPTLQEAWSEAMGEWSADPRAEFYATWDDVKVPGRSLLEAAAKMANAKRYRPLHSMSPRYDLFISLAAALQQMRGDKPIKLPVLQLAPMLTCTHQLISAYRKFAADNGLLVLVSQSRPGHQCAELRFNLEVFDENGVQIHDPKATPTPFAQVVQTICTIGNDWEQVGTNEEQLSRKSDVVDSLHHLEVRTPLQ